MNTTRSVSYAQYHEDTILTALLYDVKKGFYVDVGANYPTVDSVTLKFYKNGWTGINIEPIPDMFKQLQKARPRDINLNCAIANKSGSMTFYVNDSVPGHSSFDKKLADSTGAKLEETEVKVITLAEVITKHAPSMTINFLKIDVEGFESEVVASGDWQKHRPEVICIEANHSKVSWKTILKKNSYKLFIADGLNEYYVRAESWYRTEGYAERAVAILHNSLQLHQSTRFAAIQKERQLLRVENQQLRSQNHLQEANIEQLRDATKLSLSGIRYRARIKRSLIGLTADWIHYMRSRNTRK